MIGRISGILIEKNPPQILIDVQGLGYLVEVPMSTFYDLPNSGERVTLLTHFVVREDAQLLYGFLTASEKTAFMQLVKISGVGPRTALGLLSGLSTNDLAQAVALQDASRLTRVPGIGKKTAERLLLELKGKLTPALTGGGEAHPAHADGQANLDVLNALLALGYSDKEASQAVKSLPPDLGVSAGIREALKRLSGVKS